MSPTTIIARLATGDVYTGLVDVSVFAIPLVVMMGMLLWGLEHASSARNTAS